MDIKEPVKAQESDLYSAVLEGADGIVHFWLPNGDYDGYCVPHTENTE